jgi:hypothetical protein
MWIIAKSGFVSLVQHNTDPDKIRARARRREHLVETFDLSDDEVIDLGENAPDYRWHCELTRSEVREVMMDMVDTLDYTSHVKEEVSGPDNQMYNAMMRCWSALMTLQRPERPESDWWHDRDDYYDERAGNWDDVINDPDKFRAISEELADKMLAGSADTNPTLAATIWKGPKRVKCTICEDDIVPEIDEYVVLPADAAQPFPGQRAHCDCAEDMGYDVGYE